jgi:hypothetical protein
MKCDSWVSFLARTFSSPCFGREPKVRVTTWKMINKEKKVRFTSHIMEKINKQEEIAMKNFKLKK